MKDCMVESCATPIGKSGAKGYCPFHYRRFSKYGDALVVLPEDYHGTWGKCSVDGCLKPVRSRFADWCAMHYHRWYRSGDVGEVRERTRKQRDGKCAVENCINDDTHGIYCSKHSARFSRHGDPETVISLEDREIRRKDDHPNWRGDEAGYDAVHHRLIRWKGKASNYKCIDCADPAEEWSYSNADANERICEKGRRYSFDPDHYDPRCVPCHRAFDASYLASKRVPAPADVGVFLFPNN